MCNALILLINLLSKSAVVSVFDMSASADGALRPLVPRTIHYYAIIGRIRGPRTYRSTTASDCRLAQRAGSARAAARAKPARAAARANWRARRGHTDDRRPASATSCRACSLLVNAESSQIPRKVYVHNLSSRTDDSYLTSSGPSALSHLASTSASQRRSSKPAAAAAVASASQQRGVRPASATAASASCIAPSACAICARARERPMSASMSHES